MNIGSLGRDSLFFLSNHVDSLSLDWGSEHDAEQYIKAKILASVYTPGDSFVRILVSPEKAILAAPYLQKLVDNHYSVSVQNVRSRFRGYTLKEIIVDFGS